MARVWQGNGTTGDSNPAGVADLAGDVVLDDGGQDPIEDEHNVLADNATGQSSVGKERWVRTDIF